MTDATGDKFDLDMTMRLAADRVLRAMTLKRQAKVAVLASAALSVVAAVRPDLLPPDLLVLKELLNVGAISGLLKKVAEGGEKMTDEAVAAEMAALLPLDRLDDLVTGQKDLLRALTRQHTWQQQMLRLQEADQEASARLLAGFAEMTGDLAAIRESLAGVATAAQIDALTRLIVEMVLPRLSEPVRVKYNMSGNFLGATLFIESQVTLPWSPLPPFTPAP
ncbi:MAG: hypothetical protein KBF17_08125, partial [Candidatus Promineofilum sp.]|nr:hypothetical protein [Promineifilum sp.]